VPYLRSFVAASLLAALILAATPARALDPTKPLSACTVDTWRTRDGLPGDWLRSIVQTPDGYLWVGTQAGVARYGGGSVDTLPSPPGLERADYVTRLWAARDGTVWIVPSRGAPACARQGVIGECFTSELIRPATQIADLQVDAAGVVWIAASDGLYSHSGTLSRLDTELPFTQPTAIHRDAGGRLWVGAASGLYLREGKTFVRRGTERFVVAFFEKENRLWVAAEGEILRIEGERITTLGEREGAPAARPTAIIEDRDGNVWIGSRTGLTRLRFEGSRPTFVTFAARDGLPNDDVTSVFEDREGSLWVGSHGGGLAQFTDRTLDGQVGPPGFRDQYVGTVAEDPTGALWLGNAQGLVRWKDGVERVFRRADGLPSDNVLAVQPDGDVLWVGTDHGLARVRLDAVDVPHPGLGAITAFHLDGRRTLWIGSDRAVSRLRDGHLETIPVDADVTVNDVRALRDDDAGTLWVSSGGKLLWLKDGRLRHWLVGSSPGPGRVRALLRDGDGTLWMGSHDGLSRYRGGKWRSFGAAEGLPRTDLYQLVGDDHGFLWAGTTHGILRISKRSIEEVDRGRSPRLDVVSFESSDRRRELGAMRARQPASWKTREGTLLFATNRGILRADPRRLRANAQPPPVSIETAFVDGRPARDGTDNAFPPGSGALEFHFSGVTLLEPQKAQHRYRLEGFEDRWVEAGTRRVAYYTNIPPGRYRFRVRASNADGVWNETGASLAFSLAPHIYQTWWFYALAGLAALGLGLFIHRLRVARVHSQYAATFAERTRVARELHDSLLQGMSGAIMHLRGLRKRFGAGAPPAELVEEVKQIEEVIGTNMEETRRFVWNLRTQPEGALGPALAALTRPLADQVEAHVEVQGAEVPLPPHVQRELLRIAGEAMTNARKHAQPRHIDVRLCYEEDRVTLTVRDDGSGFDPERAPGSADGHFGLLGMRERAAGIGALVIESRPGQGTKVEVVVNRRELHDA
jgi:ligand-binding sensor domain-containing protein/anti-sigma regulatory factor (Ser/Thr protein kinase)